MRVLLLLLVIGLTGCAQTGERIFELGLRIERERAGVAARVVETDGYQLAYLERPGEGDTLVLLHGFASEKDAWIRFIRFIPKEYRVLAFDLPGHGGSSKRANETYDVDYIVARLAEALDSAGETRFHIAGNSLGGMVALLYAHQNPDRVVSLGLFDAAGVDPPQVSVFERMLEEGENPLIVDSREDFDRLMALVFEDPPLMPWPVGMVLTQRYIERAAFHEKMWQDIWTRRREVTGLLTQVDLPVFILWGEEDRILDPSSVEVFVRRLPRAEVHMMMETGHSPMIERPWRSAGLYRDFVRRSGQGSNGSGDG